MSVFGKSKHNWWGGKKLVCYMLPCVLTGTFPCMLMCHMLVHATRSLFIYIVQIRYNPAFCHVIISDNHLF
ncbi:hypothetical protein XENTR_v10000601 [Xenopus tropicalis]|nr:hypothetical protein XENTR_v10000601 [Xenopus tropicalis]